MSRDLKIYHFKFPSIFFYRFKMNKYDIYILPKKIDIYILFFVTQTMSS